jgi:glycosyltransferase involved in cell wall biosynthesis
VSLIYINPCNENWLIDRLRGEFLEKYPNLCTNEISNASTVWLIAPWCFSNYRLLKNKRVISSIYHLVPEKIDLNYLKRISEVSNQIHTISYKSQEQIQETLNRKATVIPFWINLNFWKNQSKIDTRKHLNLPDNNYIIGSFQRDTEGKDLKSPKLEKGPDQLFEIIKSIHTKIHNLHVLVGGYRRQFIINRLKTHDIPHTYIEKASQKTLLNMYNALDLYIVASRYEGGPQAIVECAATKTPIISTDVGCAKMVLDPKSIFEYPKYETAKPNIKVAFHNAQQLTWYKLQTKYLNLLINNN